jgi:NTE family protein
MTKPKRPKIGLALGSGSAKGLAHIGVIKILEKNNIPIDFIAGSSMGAMVGGFYAVTKDIKKVENIALTTGWHQILSLIDPSFSQGLISGEKVESFIESYVHRKRIEDCKVPFAAVATNLKTGEIVILNKGKMTSAIRASISIPLVFKPVKIGNKMLVDGGLSVPVPTEIVRNMGADIVIAVNLDKHYYDEERKPGWYDIANDSLNILRHHLSHLNTKEADIIIDIDLRNEFWYKFVNAKNKILVGEKAMKRKLPQLQKLIYQKSKRGIKKYFDFFDKLINR